MKYPLILTTPQTIEYNVLHAIENDKPQAHFVQKYLHRIGVDYSPRQVYGAMQRLRKSGLIAKEHGLWVLSPNARNQAPQPEDGLR